MTNQTGQEPNLMLLQGGRVDRRQLDADPRLARRRIKLALGATAAAALATGVLMFGGSDERRTTIVEPDQTLSGIAEQELIKSGNSDPSTKEINDKVREIVDANRKRLSGDTARAGTEIELP